MEQAGNIKNKDSELEKQENTEILSKEQANGYLFKPSKAQKHHNDLTGHLLGLFRYPSCENVPLRVTFVL